MMAPMKTGRKAKAEEMFGRRVAAYRTMRDISQEKLARQMGVSQSMVSRIESGDPPDAVMFVPRLAKILKVDIEDLFVNEGPLK